ncbi:MAG: hypothetical protein KKB31_07750 [Nanoarchaeota archaeon]|nr:hypothetical protein [Nanoarchaeota archaeon]
MANKEISDLTAASSLADADLLVIEQGGVTKKIAGSLIKNADTVDGIHAAATAAANILLALNASSKLPASITGDADTVDGKHASATPTGATIPVSEAGGTLANGWLNATATPTASKIPIAGAGGTIDPSWLLLTTLLLSSLQLVNTGPIFCKNYAGVIKNMFYLNTSDELIIGTDLATSKLIVNIDGELKRLSVDGSGFVKATAL